ncbi:RICIN domain-containing protein [Streptomyces sp. NBC_00647]|uniref:RICIN domain-containing protein n=1 Tax=Streptomyces sp. NBC_00647 TaxID=2975796 RepID=UPI0032487606
MKLKAILSVVWAVACAFVFMTPTNAAAAAGQPVVLQFSSAATGLCLDSDTGGYVYAKSCGSNNSFQKWNTYRDGNRMMVQNVATGRCLTGKSQSAWYPVTEPCDGLKSEQYWEDWDPAATKVLLVNNRYKYAVTNGSCCDGNGDEIVSLSTHPLVGEPSHTWLL